MAQATTQGGSGYTFARGFPTGDTSRKAYDEADLERAIQAYKFFYPTVSGAAIIKGNEQIGVIPNKVFGVLDCQPPAGQEGRWIKTLPGRGWFVYFRIYGPEGAAFDGSWRPGDFERIVG